MENDIAKAGKTKNIFKRLLFNIGCSLGVEEINVYFVSGMCNNCSVFDSIILPKGYNKKYIEWIIPDMNDTLEEYALKMAKDIDTSKPFVLVGYSFGANIVQEMNKFITPEKNIIISSMKRKEEIPAIFNFAHSIHFAERVPDKVLAATDFIINVFTKFIYNMPTDKITRYMIYTDPVYLKWSIRQITNWQPVDECKHIYHIHGTKDQIFPYDQISDDVYTIKGGDHLMVMERAHEVSDVISMILTKREH